MPVERAVQEFPSENFGLRGDWEPGNPAEKKSRRSLLNVRAVGFIAKPHRVGDLAACFEGPVANLLMQVPGFSGAMILNCHNEWRKITVLTFWQTEAQAAKCHWEEYSTVRRLTAPLVDLSVKVETFDAVLPATSCPEEENAIAVIS